VCTRTYGTKDVASIELGSGQEVERGSKETDPGGAPNGRKQKKVGIHAGMKQRVEEAKQ